MKSTYGMGNEITSGKFINYEITINLNKGNEKNLAFFFLVI